MIAARLVALIGGTFGRLPKVAVAHRHPDPTKSSRSQAESRQRRRIRRLQLISRLVIGAAEPTKTSGIHTQ